MTITQLNDLILSIVVSLAKNEDFTQTNYNLFKFDLFEQLYDLLSNCESNSYVNVKQVLSDVRKLINQRDDKCSKRDPIKKILRTLAQELTDAQHCMDCVFNKVMYKDGYARVCSKPHLLVWSPFVTNFSSKRNPRPTFCPAKVINVNIECDNYSIRYFNDRCSSLRERSLSSNQVFNWQNIILTPKHYQGRLRSKRYRQYRYTIRLLNEHLNELRSKYGTTKLLYRNNLQKWTGNDVTLPDNDDETLVFKNFIPEAMCSR